MQFLKRKFGLGLCAFVFCCGCVLHLDRDVEHEVAIRRLALYLCVFFSHIFVSFCVCLCFVVVVIEMQSTRWLSGDRHSHRLLTKISLACRDRPHTPPISSFSVVYTFVLAVCVLCTLCMHIYQKVTSENKTHTANFI